jgi:DNA-binding XRE family transcriptional regulator
VRKTAIPKREIQVLKRLREAREKLGLSQPEFAQQIDITRAKLANFENFKTPLPCDLALKICHQFIIGEKWLATGQGPMRMFINLTDFVENPSLYRMPFGEAYDTGLAKWADDQTDQMETIGATHTFSKPSSGNVNDLFYKNYCNMIIDNWIDELRNQGKQEVFGEVIEAMISAGGVQLRKLVKVPRASHLR